MNYSGRMRKMKNKFFKTINKDERINRLIYKYGFEAFAIMSLILSGYMIYHTLIGDFSVSDHRFEFILLAVGGTYFILRSALGGLISLPNHKDERRDFIKYIIMGNILFGLLFGTYISIRNTILYLNGDFGYLSLSILLITAVSAMFLGFFIIGIFLLISNYKAKKELTD